MAKLAYGLTVWLAWWLRELLRLVFLLVVVVMILANMASWLFLVVWWLIE